MSHSKIPLEFYMGLQMQTRRMSILRGGRLTSVAEGSRERADFPILDEQFCVVTCVVTLASLPVSGAVDRCRSGTGEGQGTAPKAA